jgi:DNA modification methylase
VTVSILTGDCRERLAELPSESVHCIVTSPPYFGLRDYGVAGQIGLEATPDAFVSELVAVFRECRRVLRADGTLWLNLGDSYASSPPGNKTVGVSAKSGLHGINGASGQYRETLAAGHATKRDTSKIAGLKAKDLIGIPWRVAFALQADGWWLRQDIIWSKPNPMPESVTDRCTKAHEYLFLLSKSATYHYDADAVREEAEYGRREGTNWKRPREADPRDGRQSEAQTVRGADPEAGRNRRSVWTVATQPFSEAHFATFPPDLIEPCIKAGTSEKGCCAKCGKPWVRDVGRACWQ